MKMYLKCHRCDWEGQPDLEHAGPHIKATCPSCNMYIKFVKQTDLDMKDSNMLERTQDEDENDEAILTCPHCSREIILIPKEV